MNKIEGTIIEAGNIEGVGRATCGIVVWTTARQKAEMERWEYDGRVVIERKADHDARETEVERLRDANLQRVAEGMSRWCAPQSPQSPHLDAIADANADALAQSQHNDRLGNWRVEALRENVRRLKAELESATSRPLMNPHLDAIAEALQHAKQKHPKFADVAVSYIDFRKAVDQIAIAREYLADKVKANRCGGMTVLMCEVYEAIEAFSRKDYAATMDELAQCGAVVVRMMEAVQELIDGQEQAAKAGEEPIK